VYESIQNVVQIEPGRREGASETEEVLLLTTRETQTEPAQLMQRSLRISDPQGNGHANANSPSPAAEAITAFPHPQPALIGVHSLLENCTKNALSSDDTGKQLGMPPHAADAGRGQGSRRS
jgi:hypothetical protein